MRPFPNLRINAIPYRNKKYRGIVYPNTKLFGIIKFNSPLSISAASLSFSCHPWKETVERFCLTPNYQVIDCDYVLYAFVTVVAFDANLHVLCGGKLRIKL